MSQQPRTIVLVGASSGIGREAASQLAARQHRLILIGRSPQRCRHLQHDLPGATIVNADVSTQAGVLRAAAAIASVTDHVDTLINNAGVMLPDRRLSSEGDELNRAVHHLAPHRLTLELLPLLRRGDGRVVNVNSEGHRAAMFSNASVYIDFAELDSERNYDPFLAYSRSKLANLLDTYELQRRHPELTAVAVHPGMVRTDLGRHFPRVRVAAMHAISLSARKGAAPVIGLATAPELRGGAYYNRFTAVRSSGPSYDRGCASTLWDHTEQRTTPGK
jgi:NAD(P)-dependent dehydrogenase (short-subunit alcohol dehydrogenase family)